MCVHGVRAWRARVRCIARALEGGVHAPPAPGNLRLLPAPRLLQHQEGLVPARPFSASIFLDKNRRDIGKSRSIWTDSKMKTAGSHVIQLLQRQSLAVARLDAFFIGTTSTKQQHIGPHMHARTHTHTV
eukprot:COSAG01_NODE_28840_length_651_cov_2.153986_1_plen_129_part_00